MMWFVPTQRPVERIWFDRFQERLREGSPAVTGLLDSNPFAARPPLFLRVKAYRYRFTSPAERRRSGNWWK
ncbi:MAG: lipase maturation factor family protein, partial [Gammaproteobacteria bacterium]